MHEFLNAREIWPPTVYTQNPQTNQLGEQITMFKVNLSLFVSYEQLKFICALTSSYPMIEMIINTPRCRLHLFSMC